MKPMPQPVCHLCHLLMGSAEKGKIVKGQIAHESCARLHELGGQTIHRKKPLLYRPEMDDAEGR